MKIKAIFPGTFDPITNGHVDLIGRASLLFDQLIVAIANNPTKKPRFNLAERVALVKEVTKHLPNVTVIGFSGLLVNLAKDNQAKVLVRGVRTVVDFEYEYQLANVNRKLYSELETIYLTPSESNAAISSTIVKEVHLHGGDVSAFVPQAVLTALNKCNH